MRTSGMTVQIAIGVALMAASSAALPAQMTHTVVGSVRDSAGTPLFGAVVAVVQQGVETRTDSAGTFRLGVTSPGELDIAVRRLGYVAQVVRRTVFGTDSLVVHLTRRAVMLEEVAVSEVDLRRRFWIEDFYRRRARGSGTYFTREEIAARKSSRLTDVLSAAPGLRMIRTNGALGVRFVSAATLRRDCAPMIWLDGQRAPGMEVDQLQASDIEGIELYHGPSTTPLRFSQGHYTTCGTIVIWTRLPGT